jgi:hypothetical protein
MIWRGFRLRDYAMAAAVAFLLFATGFCAGYLTAALICAVRSLG